MTVDDRHRRGVGLGWLLAVAAIFVVAPPRGAAGPLANEAAPGQAGQVVLLVVDGGINPATADYIGEGIAAAGAEGARAVLIELDTPGGLLPSAQAIVKTILAAPLPVIVYIAPSGAGATSAGVFVLLAAHVAAMAPGTTVGAAHPVGGQGEDIGGDMRAKVENFAASLSRTIAEKRGRNVEWAEQAVRESVSATEREALELKIVDLVAPDVDDLLRQVDGRTIDVDGRKVVLATAGAAIVKRPMRLRQRLLDLIADPNIAYLLLMAGILGLYVEFTHPGVMLPGVAGAICLLLAFAALQVLPINSSGLALIVLGVALLVAEIFLPSFGVVGVGGMVAFVLGSLLLFETPESTVAVNRGIIAGAAFSLGLFSLVVGWLVVRAQRRPALGGAEGMVGEVGRVRRTAADGGPAKVFVHGEWWDAEAEEPLAPGDEVDVVGVHGMRLRVRRRPAR